MEAERGPGSQDSSLASNKLLQAQLSPGLLRTPGVLMGKQPCRTPWGSKFTWNGADVKAGL